jgi:D-alanyl-D-alanine carboxypeptidase
MRPVLCTQEARASRYDPGAGAAVIKSQYLSPRKKSSNILDIRSGGVDADPSPAVLTRRFAVVGKVPVPSLRPDFDRDTGQIRLPVIGVAATGNLPIPSPNPR